MDLRLTDFMHCDVDMGTDQQPDWRPLRSVSLQDISFKLIVEGELRLLQRARCSDATVLEAGEQALLDTELE